MPLADYAKFYEMLLNNGVGPATVSKKRSFRAIYISKRSFYQDRLGTNIGKLKKRTVFPQGERVLSPLGAKNAFFGAVLNVKNDLLPRQARDKHRKR